MRFFILTPTLRRGSSAVFGIAAIAVTLAGPSAHGADATPPLILRGRIAAIDTKSISIAKADGTTVTASIAATAAFSSVEKRTFEQIKATDFVGITSVPGPDGTLTAEEIHVIPVKGLNEGSYPWDHQPDGVAPVPATSMTNGTVAVVHDEPPTEYSMTNASVTASSGMQLKVTYQGSAMASGKCVGHAAPGSSRACTGVATVEVSPLTPIEAIVPAKAGDAKAGLAVFATAVPGAQGKLVVGAIIVEKNGVKPLF